MSIPSHSAVFGENAGPLTRGQAAAKVGGPAVGARRRRALGDVTNAGADARAPKLGKGAKAARYAAPALLAPEPALQLPEMEAEAPAAAAAASKAAAAEPAAQTASKEEEVEVDLGPVDIEVDSPEPDARPADARYADVDPVDVPDIGDAQAVVEYIPEIMDTLFAKECKYAAAPDYLSRQDDVNQRMRVILLNWIAEVALKFKCSKETLYLTVSVADRFLERRPVTRHKLQLVGATSLLIASKVCDQWAPLIDDIVYIAANAYTRADVLAMEVQILAVIKFHLTVPHACTFAERFGKVAGLGAEDMFVVDFLCELQLQYYGMLKYKPSDVAAAAVFLACRFGDDGAEWTEALARHTRHTEEELLPCARDLLKLLRMDEPKYTAVRKKFSSSKFGRAAYVEHEHVQL